MAPAVPTTPTLYMLVVHWMQGMTGWMGLVGVGEVCPSVEWNVIPFIILFSKNSPAAKEKAMTKRHAA
jgi:hypothetical protein